MAAAYHGRVDLCRTLLRLGVGASAADYRGATAASLARVRAFGALAGARRPAVALDARRGTVCRRASSTTLRPARSTWY